MKRLVSSEYVIVCKEVKDFYLCKIKSIIIGSYKTRRLSLFGTGKFRCGNYMERESSDMGISWIGKDPNGHWIQYYCLVRERTVV